MRVAVISAPCRTYNSQPLRNKTQWNVAFGKNAILTAAEAFDGFCDSCNELLRKGYSDDSKYLEVLAFLRLVKKDPTQAKKAAKFLSKVKKNTSSDFDIRTADNLSEFMQRK